jgi:hypothetical protein
MLRRSWIALVSLVIAAGASWGCGDSADSGQAQRSEETVKADNSAQDAMKAFMQSKKGGSKKGAAKAKPDDAKPDDAKTDETKSD